MLNDFINVGSSRILKGKSCYFKQFQNINGSVFKAKKKIDIAAFKNTINVRN